VYCQRCGAQGEEGARYCSACGATLPRAQRGTSSAEPKAGRFARLVGTSRRAQLLTAGTAVAAVVALVAFIALPASSSTTESSESASTLALDRLCVAEKQQIASAAASALRTGRAAVSDYGAALVPIIEEWRLALAQDVVPAGKLGQVQALDASLLDTMAEAGTLARVAPGGSRASILAQAARVDAATAEVERAIAKLGLQQCSQLQIGVGRLLHG
jgi:hypothetical protein